ncbi:MAG: HesA/MoeB/ThiF family protein [Planctomycetota bacterium]|nr:HesA/MoeB/ThiF family protein [Planctomycetota bacterium]
MNTELPRVPNESLSEEERATYEWQMWTPGMGEAGQLKLKNSTVLVSRCGGLGSVVAYELAAAGVGRLVLAHGGRIKPSDLNRQLLMTHDGLGTSRVDSAEQRLKDLNPRVEIVKLDANMDKALAREWVPQVDVCVGAAPLFEERFAISDACVEFNKPMVDCAMYDMEASITTYPAGGRPCLRCVTPEKPEFWKREFPVFGATSGTVACLGAIETIKLLTGIGRCLERRMIRLDLKRMSFHEFSLEQLEHCRLCRG